MGHGGLKEAALCPDIVVVKKMHVDVSDASLVVRKFNISLGPSEAYDLLGVYYTLDVSLALGQGTNVQIGLSVLPVENQVLTVLTDEAFYARGDIFAVTRSNMTDFTEAGVSNQAFVDRFTFPVPICLVHPVSLWVNKIGVGPIHVGVELHLVKKSLAMSIITQLLKVYQDVKGAFKQ